MKHSYTINILDGSGIEEFLAGIEEYKRWISEKSEELVTRLAEIGVEVAREEFSLAEYNGINDVSVSFESEGELRKAVVATGNAVLFIEFGTGITYPDGHPDKPSEISPRGTYGYHLGSLPNGWRYKEEYGRGNGDAVPDPKHPGYLKTKGNPSNMSLYLTVSQLEQRFTEIVKEVFHD